MNRLLSGHQKMPLTVEPLERCLKTPFRIAHGTSTTRTCCSGWATGWAKARCRPTYTGSLKRLCKVRRIAPSVPAGHLPRSRLTGVGFLHRCSRMSSPPRQEGCPAGTGWSIENDEKTPERCDFAHGWPSTPRPLDTPPVQEGNLNCHTEENLTALRRGGGRRGMPTQAV